MMTFVDYLKEQISELSLGKSRWQIADEYYASCWQEDLTLTEEEINDWLVVHSEWLDRLNTLRDLTLIYYRETLTSGAHDG